MSTEQNLFKLGWGKPSRRKFLAGSAATGLALGSSGLLGRPAHAQSRGDILRIGVDGGSTDNTFDPRMTIGSAHITLSVHSVYDRLTQIALDGSAAPLLATSWSVGDDGLTWRFEIDPNARFQNGAPVTPADVMYSLRYATDAESTWAEGKSFMDNIVEMRADGNAVVMVQGTADADLPIQLSSWGFSIAPEGTAGAAWNEPGNGTGPYIIESFEPGVRTVLRYNPDHYREGDGWFESVEILNIADGTSRSAAIRTGDLDIIMRPDPATARMLGRTDGVEIVAAEGALHYTAPMRATEDPFTDVNVRLAVKHAINREEMLNTILNGFGYVGNDIPIGRNQQFYNTELPQRAYDPEQARFYLQQAGLSSLDVTLAAADAAFAGAVDAASLISESARAAGINVTIDRVPNDGYWSDVWNVRPWAFSYWSGRPTIGMMMESAYTGATSWNESAWVNERFDQLIAMAKGESNPDLRRDMYWEAQEILYNEGSQLIPVFGSFVHAVSDRIGHPEFRGAYYCDNFMIARTAWSNA